jgi:hypothetical protein
MAERSQSYKNHVRWFPPYHFFVMPVLLINVVVEVRRLWMNPALGTLWGLVVALALLLLGLLARVMALAVQDRVIRLEMRQRLQDILPAELQPRISQIAPRHLVALRFACDAELPGLVREVLEGRLTSQTDIKKRITDWQPDWLRA